MILGSARFESKFRYSLTGSTQVLSFERTRRGHIRKLSIDLVFIFEYIVLPMYLQLRTLSLDGQKEPNGIYNALERTKGSGWAGYASQ